MRQFVIRRPTTWVESLQFLPNETSNFFAKSILIELDPRPPDRTIGYLVWIKVTGAPNIAWESVIESLR